MRFRMPREVRWQCPTCGHPIDRVTINSDQVWALEDCGHELRRAEWAAIVDASMTREITV